MIANLQKRKSLFLKILNIDSSKFETAHTKLGTLLEFDSGNKETTGAPDPWWIVDEELCLVFEDHSEANENSKLHVDKARQVSTHPNWIRQNLNLSETAHVIAVLITLVKSAELDALPPLDNVYVWNIDEFRKWARSSLSVIRELRTVFSASGDLSWRDQAVQKYLDNQMDPEWLVALLESRPASKVLNPHEV